MAELKRLPQKTYNDRISKGILALIIISLSIALLSIIALLIVIFS